ncbi:CLUMA_CG018383, isoform A [Clunio marinus]|uniref:CLUMA_CG018383, isoform A n=1 Tax=Clunio marinus TaxID=568069 RepID=A0A1J1IZG9_9DIPT|nr:CLUMA_CG018383, isoform A [Clunio marinus]
MNKLKGCGGREAITKEIISHALLTNQIYLNGEKQERVCVKFKQRKFDEKSRSLIFISRFNQLLKPETHRIVFKCLFVHRSVQVQ